MYQAIVSPQEDQFMAVRPGHSKGMSLPAGYYTELRDRHAHGDVVPDWFVQAGHRQWGIDLAGQRVDGALVVRAPSAAPVTYSRATYEINKGCNFSCEHCYSGTASVRGPGVAGQASDDRHAGRDGGVLVPDHRRRTAHRSRLPGRLRTCAPGRDDDRDPHQRLAAGPSAACVELFRQRPPHRITVSLYGASPATADRLTRTRGAFKNMADGVRAARAAGLPLQLTIIITRHNVDDVDAMRALADDLGVPRKEYGMISPTYTGTAEPLDAQAPGFADASFLESEAPGALVVPARMTVARPGTRFSTSIRTGWSPCARSAATTRSTLSGGPAGTAASSSYCGRPDASHRWLHGLHVVEHVPGLPAVGPHLPGGEGTTAHLLPARRKDSA